jgi:hypothetical protein
MSLTRGLVFSSEVSLGTITYTRLPSGLWVHTQNTNTDRVSLGTPSSINFTYHNFTILAWINLTTTATNTIFSRINTGNDGWAFYIDANGAITAYSLSGGGGDVSYSSNGLISLNTWYFVSMIRNGTDCYTYLNGLDVTNTHGVHSNPSDLSAFIAYLGNYSTLVLGLLGYYSIVNIFQRVLSAAEILKLYNRDKWMFGL